jgi:UDP-N-acetylglucosamine acyltransferase
MQIHPTAIIEEGARLGNNVKIGPFCVIGKDVVLGDGVELKSHVVISGNTTIGEGTCIYPFASIGSAPQDLKYAGEQTELIIGKHNIIREYVTINPGTSTGKVRTVVGDKCLIMIGAHIAHDCTVGNHVIMANNATLAGHVTVEDYAILGGLSAVHQFVRIGKHAMIGGTSGVKYDVPPFALVLAQEPTTAGINVVGLKRHNFSKSDILALKASYDMLFSTQHNILEAVEMIKAKFGDHPSVNVLLDFLSRDSTRGIRKPEHSYERT